MVWTLGLGASLVMLALLTLGPLLMPRSMAPTVLRQDLPPPTIAEATANPAPEYPSTASVQPLISGRLDLNTASVEQLEALPNVGEKTAQKIIQARPLRSLTDVDAINGIGEKTMAELTPLVTF